MHSNKYGEILMFKTEMEYFQSEFDKNIILYGAETQYRNLHLDTEKLFQSIKEQKDVGSTTVCEGVSIGKASQHSLPVIIFERILFTGEHIELLSKLFSIEDNRHNEYLISAIYFIDCKFRYPVIQQLPTYTSICFKGCIFKKDIVFLDDVIGRLCFVECHFRARLSFENIKIKSMLHIQDSWFEQDSLFNLNNTHIKGVCKFAIKNTQFYGKFEARKTKIDSVGKFTNVSFFNQLQIEDLILSKYCLFEHFSFANASSKDMIIAQSKFAQTLQQNGYEQIIPYIGLITEPQTKISDDTEEREYQDALQKGWLNPKQAARFLGKSVRTLQEKRKNDQMKITKESLPFIGEGKDILYPLDALKAYLEQDWNLLKELRKKHWKK